VEIEVQTYLFDGKCKTRFKKETKQRAAGTNIWNSFQVAKDLDGKT